MTATERTPKEIAQQIVNANTPGLKAAATKALNKHVALRSAEGKEENRTRAGISALVTKLKNGN